MPDKLYPGQVFRSVDLGALLTGEPSGDYADLRVRLVYQDTHPTDATRLVDYCDAIDSVYGREHDYLTLPDIVAAQS